MGLVSPELSLDLKPSFVPDAINGVLQQVSVIGDTSEKLEKVDHFLRRLEDEMKKIQVFKRELPLCMLLLKDAILVLRQESAQIRMKSAHQPVLEEFIPIRKEHDDGDSQISDKNNHSDRTDEEDSSRDKKDWMSSVQLWSADNVPSSTSQNCIRNETQTLGLEKQKLQEDDRSIFVSDSVYDSCKIMTGSKGYVPMIHAYPNYRDITRKVEENVGVQGLSMLTPGIKYAKEESLSNGLNSRLGVSKVSCSSSFANGQSNLRPNHQQSTIRKQRRCWSPELHRRFVDALTQLGGAQVATPKQIRELMRVDGLTNDEVKSHLQKYRLHNRRSPSNSTASMNENRNEIAASWVTQDQCSDSLKPNNSQSGSPQGPLQFPGGDSMEDIDDEKSESYSWKGHVHSDRHEQDDV